MDHVYAGSGNDTPVPWYDNFNSKYFELLRNYHNEVIIEVVGHDHIADVRFHSSSNVWDLPEVTPEF
jgi:hypothetical protein